MGEPRGLDAEGLRRIVERHFRVYDAREEKVRGETAALLYYLMFPAQEFDARFAAARAELQAADPELLVFVRRESGEDILFVAHRPPAAQHRTGLHVGLLLATIVTTVLSGAVTWHGYVSHAGDELTWSVLWNPEDLLWGAVSFALPLLLILGLHELAHFVVARKHGLRASLPFFIPAPPVLVPFGTLGAFISMRDPMPDRKALFDVGAAGPLAGFLVTLPVILLGAFLTGAVAQPVPDFGHPAIAADVPATLTMESGHATLVANVSGPGFLTFNVTPPPEARGEWPYAVQATVHLRGGGSAEERVERILQPGQGERRSVALPADAASVTLDLTWSDGLLRLGDPLLVQLLDKVFHNDGYLTHPTFLAGWVGLLVTGINLLPAGQLDGGHVARAVLGERMRYVAIAAVGLLMVLAFLFNSWLLMAFFLLVTGIQHAPPLNDRTVLDRKRLALAVVVLAVFILTFVPVPIQV